MTDRVEIPTVALSQVIERLTERRIVVEKAVSTLGEAPQGLRDVFELCRGFEKAFSNIVNESPVANRIKEAFFSEKGLAGNVQRLPFDKLFSIDSVKKITKTADGYQPHLVSPERGLQLMASKALDQVEGPVQECVSQVYTLLISAARDAASVAGEHTEAAMNGKVPLIVPEFRTFIMPAVVRALDEWRSEGEKMAQMLVDMERSYITAGFFRYTMYRRFEASQSQAAVQKALAKGGKKKGFMDRVGLGGGGGGGAEPDFAAPGAPDAAGAMVPRAPGAPSGAGSAAGGGISLGSLADPNDYIAAHFDKKVNEESARQSLPVDGWRWQKRFFIFSDSNKTLYYFKTPDDVPKPNGLRGQISLVDCIIEDLDERGNVRPAIGSAMVEMQRGERASLLLRIRSLDPRRPCVKDHNSIVLRAENVGNKYEWISRMMRAVAASAGPSPPPPVQAQPQPAAADPRRASKDVIADANGQPAGVAPQPLGSPGSAPSEASELVDPLSEAAGVQLSRRNSFEVMTSTRLGQGAKFFRAEELRDNHGRLQPAPPIVLGPMAPGGGLQPQQQQASAAMRLAELAKKPLTVQETWETRYEQLMEQFASDMQMYITMVCDTIVTTVPKSVVHCLVRKAEKNLLNHLFGHVHKMSEEELKRMLTEDSSVTEKRAAVRLLYDKIKMAIDDVQYKQEKVKRKDHEGDNVLMDAEVLALAVMTDLLSGEQRRRYTDMIDSPYMPALRAPVPLSHVDRPKKLPTAPQGLVEGQAAAAGLARTSVGAGAPARRAPAVPARPAANGMPSTPSARRAPPPPPK
uniref:Dynamin GTPase n=1 Tax=Tetradesmus obliquus TaxID=3088 RepID=A0A383V9W8_TETOB|eukprot:jgi/Sobl393_1/15483/SZX61730.1